MTDLPAYVQQDRQGHVLIITINRPEVRNAFNARTSEQMCAAMDRLDQDPDLFLGIVTGAGGIFSAGADLKAVAEGAGSGNTTRGPFGICEKPAAKPLIAAVEGYAVGGGMEVVLACDLIVAARDARFALPEVKHNLVALAGGAFRLPRRLPYHLAMEFALTGAMRDAIYCHNHGLVNRLSEPGTALDAAMALAEQLLENGPTALAATAAIMRRSVDWSTAEAWSTQRSLAAPALQAADRLEGIRAFVEKRKPRWSGG